LNKSLILFFFLVCSFFSGYGQSRSRQEKSADSIDVLISLADKENLGSNFDKALEYSIIAVKLANISTNKEYQGRAYNSLGSTYQILHDYNSSEKYLLLALKFGREIENGSIISSALNGLGNVYSSEEETLDLAIKYYKEAFEYTKEGDNPKNITAWYLNMAGMFLDFEKTEDALIYLNSAKETLTQFKVKEPVYIATYYYLEGLYNKQNRTYTKAIEYLNEVIEIGIKNNLYLELIDSYELKFQIYQEEGDNILAIENLKRKEFYKDLNIDSEARLKIEELNTQFKINEYEKELSRAQLQEEASNYRNGIITAVVVLFVLFFILIFFFIYTFKERQRHKDLKEVKSKTEHLTKLKSELLSNISHELRTPLYGIMGITAMLSEHDDLNPDQKNLINSLQFSGNRLHELVNKILRITEIESNRVAIKKTVTNIKEATNDLVNSLNYSAKEKNNKLNVQVDESIKAFYNIDGLKLTEILDNLISNAIKFTDNGSIAVSVAKQSTKKNIDFLEFKIEDTGIGIANENHALIFENFKRAIEENTSHGSGLGLSIVKNYIEAMGGTIHLESELGVGSVFSFVLPCEIATADIISEKNKREQDQPVSILVVEDNKINQMITNKLIVSIGHTCTIAHHGLEAVERCKTEDFDLILMDINMPLMNGFEASKGIKSFKPNSNIVALTALEISEIKTKCLEAGISNIVNKPIGKSQLKDIINRSVQ
jgi:signal transduction histidine kinase/CheY-like chemotaxis protein